MTRMDGLCVERLGPCAACCQARRAIIAVFLEVDKGALILGSVRGQGQAQSLDAII